MAPKSPKWFFKNSPDRKAGPFYWEDILEFVRQNKVSPNSLLMHPTQTKGEWVQAKKIKQLQDYFGEDSDAARKLDGWLKSRKETPANQLIVPVPIPSASARSQTEHFFDFSEQAAPYEVRLMQNGQVYATWSSSDYALSLRSYFIRSVEHNQLILEGLYSQSADIESRYRGTQRAAGPSLWRYYNRGLGGTLYSLQIGIKTASGISYGIQNASITGRLSFHKAVDMNLRQLILQIEDWIVKNGHHPKNAVLVDIDLPPVHQLPIYTPPQQLIESRHASKRLNSCLITIMIIFMVLVLACVGLIVFPKVI